MTGLHPETIRILDTIDAIRAEHHACTLGAVCHRLRLQKGRTQVRMRALRQAGLVTWTPLTGSLRVVSREPAPARTHPDTPEARQAASPADTGAATASALEETPEEKAARIHQARLAGLAKGRQIAAENRRKRQAATSQARSR